MVRCVPARIRFNSVRHRKNTCISVVFPLPAIPITIHTGIFGLIGGVTDAFLVGEGPTVAVAAAAAAVAALVLVVVALVEIEEAELVAENAGFLSVFDNAGLSLLWYAPLWIGGGIEGLSMIIGSGGGLEAIARQ